ncbi:ATP-dependent DNA helicase RecG [Serpentinicella sp. ANB-PHB4]|uniref:ATP-dependent DNA helicase RecG n=1 Tax=Serpentinicella sp. ANB-PHB4 TaxID=3074076 RepID=UPI00285CA243|nr:ATP-dependent DNA helicase RecG [Serpentinicella sp. ANB-PHB4]MDR5658309.1 ATP-dependent DNA helicase RecG [Serpentinicella sp. ANB-PHB4]
MMHDQLDSINGIGPKKLLKYKRLDIYNIKDLLFHFPRTYIMVDGTKQIKDIVIDDHVSIVVQVMSQITSKKTSKGYFISRCLVTDNTGTLWITFFNNPYIRNKIKYGQKITVSGQVKKGVMGLELVNPDFNLSVSTHSKKIKIIPVYSVTEGITQKEMKDVQKKAQKYLTQVTDYIPEHIRKRMKLCGLEYALRNIHFPESIKALKVARYRLIFEEFLLLQLGLLRLKKDNKELLPSKPLVKNKGLDGFISKLPFNLTEAQQKVLNDVFTDLKSEKPMNRLIQGDVGSGKTIIAIISLYKCVINNCQGALMAPTEILAEQHFNVIKRLLEPYGVKICLLTGSLKNREKKELHNKIETGYFHIVIGTHAIIQSSVVFKDLALVITDEQHRFGVKQRGSLMQKGVSPHVLVMSATPIPRTLAMINYGDLDISIIDKLPKGRKKIITYAERISNKNLVYNLIREELSTGRQAYVVCPLVENSEVIEAQSVMEKTKELMSYFPEYKIGFIHGKMSSNEKEKTMLDFKNNNLNILISTTVIEVGIDVPNATIIIIENAERFGLAQLHQLRGRVGRGSSQSYCYLLHNANNKLANERMEIMKSTNDGFIISEKDLELRGPGDFFGVKQHGLLKLKIAEFFKHIKILNKVQNTVRQLLEEDLELKLDKYPLLNQKLKEVLKNIGSI